MPDLVLGVDGGGTKTLAWLAPLDDAENTIVLGRGRAGPGNVRAVGFETAQTNIAAAIEAAFRDAGLPSMTVAAACMGLAGAGRQTEQKHLVQWAIEAKIAKQVRVCGDAEPVLAAATPAGPGVALICGTGSLAWGRSEAGQTARCGGWGYLLGDEGSGYAIALGGLRAAVRAADGRGPETLLLAQLLASLQLATAEELVQAIYSPEMTRERLAALSREVFEVAESDAVALSIVRQAAGELAKLVTTLKSRLQLAARGYALAMTGSVLLRQPVLRAWLNDELAKAAAEPGEVRFVEEPVEGAVALARLHNY